MDMELERLIATGNTADLYLYENRIVKLFHEGAPEGVADYEAAKQRCAHSLKLPVPEIFGVTEISGRQAIIMEHVAGRTIGETALEDMGKAEYYIGISVDMQRKIHAASTNSLETTSDWLRWGITSGPLEDRQKSALLQRLSEMPAGNTLCHGDFHAHNLILSDDGVIIIDWCDASAGDPRADICRSYLLFLLHSEELADLYLRIYCEKSGFAKEDILSWFPVIAGARLSEIGPGEDADRLSEIVNRFICL